MKHCILAIAACLPLAAACRPREIPADDLPKNSASQAATLPSRPNGITIDNASVAINERWRVSSTSRMTLEVGNPQIPQQGVSADHEQVDVRIEQVTQVSNGIPSALRVTYEKGSLRETHDGTTTTEQSPTVGKTYVVEVRDSRLRIEPQSGGATNKELNQVDRDYRWLLSGRWPRPVIKAGRYGPGDNAALANANLIAGGARDESVSLVFLEQTSPDASAPMAVFRVSTAQHLSDEGAPPMVAKLTGTLSVGTANGHLTNLSLQGPLTMTPMQSGGPPGLTIPSKGTLEIRVVCERLPIAAPTPPP